MNEKQRKKLIIGVVVAFLVLFAGIVVEFFVHRYVTNRSVVFRTVNSKVHIFRDKKWRNFNVQGVSIGMGEQPGVENAADSRKEYTRLFRELAAVNTNVIHVDTILSPAFYRAFFEYNAFSAKPLYLMQGIRMGESGIKTNLDAYDDKLRNAFLEEIKRTIDVVHGKAAKQPDGQNSGNYNLNIAPYVVGYILGEEMDEEFVITTNQKNPHITGFEGVYLYTQDASPYEAWLAWVGDAAITYERKNYGGPYKLLSWPDWMGMDVITRPDEDEKENGAMDIKYARIQTTERYTAGILSARQLWEKFTGHHLVKEQ